MGLVLTEDQQMLKQAAKDFFADNASVDTFREMRDRGDTHNAELWQQMSELGWPAVAVPEAHGGLEFGLTGLGLIVVESGRNLTVSPLVATSAVGAAAIAQGQSEAAKKSLLPGIAAGETLVAFAVDELNHHDPNYTEAKAVSQGDGYVLDGKKVFVAEGSYADHFVVVARDDDGQFVVLLVDATADGVEREQVRLMDNRDYANVAFSSVRVSADAVLASGEQGESLVRTLVDIGTVLSACELYGIAQQLFEITVQYLADRKQFGRPIGSFQALQHRAAHAFVQLQLLKSVVLDALDAAESQRKDFAMAASHVKALANDTADLITNEAVQMHGGIGLTDELDVGLYFKRARTLRNAYGLSSYHRRRFARLSGY